MSVRFGGHMALQDVSLQIDQGRITGLIGPNGAGKTTLFNVITGLLEPVRGKVLLNGIDVTRFPPHHRAQRGMARTFQRIELFGSLTAQENLLVAAEIPRSWGGSTALSPAERVEEAIDIIGMADFAETRADVLTTGQARLVELGRAVVTGPKVLLLDEPASGLDADETDEFAAILDDLASTGVGILLVEHDMPLVMRACSRLFVLDFGRIIASGSPAEIQHDQAVIDAYLGAPAGAEA
ncbi:MAG: ABC transporter ATP-binding protein [Acidimicrobiales bacterium]